MKVGGEEFEVPQLNPDEAKKIRELSEDKGKITPYVLCWWASPNGYYVGTKRSSEFDDEEKGTIATQIREEFSGKGKLERIASFFDAEVKPIAVIEDNFIGQPVGGGQKSYIVGSIKSEKVPAIITVRLGAWIDGKGESDPCLEVLAVQPGRGLLYVGRWAAVYRPNRISWKGKTNCDNRIEGKDVDLSLLVPNVIEQCILSGDSLEDAYLEAVHNR